MNVYSDYSVSDDEREANDELLEVTTLRAGVVPNAHANQYRFNKINVIDSYIKQSLLSGLLYHDHACSRLSRSLRSLSSSTMSLARDISDQQDDVFFPRAS